MPELNDTKFTDNKFVDMICGQGIIIKLTRKGEDYIKPK
jgi:hypothetical protein